MLICVLHGDIVAFTVRKILQDVYKRQGLHRRGGHGQRQLYAGQHHRAFLRRSSARPLYQMCIRDRAWVYQFIEALADGGVACGLPRAKAQEYAAQMVLGSAKLVLESGKHPGALKDAVCSPGGSTIQGVRVLEEHGLRGAVMDAVLAAYDKTKEMGKG